MRNYKFDVLFHTLSKLVNLVCGSVNVRRLFDHVDSLFANLKSRTYNSDDDALWKNPMLLLTGGKFYFYHRATVVWSFFTMSLNSI